MAKSFVVQGPNGSETLTELTDINLVNALTKAGIYTDTVIIKCGNVEFTLSKITGEGSVSLLRNGHRFINPFRRARGMADQAFLAEVVDRTISNITERLKMNK